ncbi:MAG: DUF805 domain-containing protein [Maribacter sp.]
MNWYLKALKQYANFTGRSRRKEFWMFVLFHFIFLYGTVIIGAALEVTALFVVAGIYVIATIIPYWALAVRRMHDIGKSGWFFLIPYYNIYLCCLNGEFGNNQYGPDPKITEDTKLQKV